MAKEKKQKSGIKGRKADISETTMMKSAKNRGDRENQ
jgi:hypothetical protein